MCLRVVGNDYSDHKKHLLAKTITIHTVGNAVKDMWIGLNDLMLHRRRLYSTPGLLESFMRLV